MILYNVIKAESMGSCHKKYKRDLNYFKKLWFDVISISMRNWLNYFKEKPKIKSEK